MWRGLTTASDALVLQGEGVRLRPPAPRDYEAWVALRSESAASLQKYEPRWPADELTRFGFRRRLRSYQAEMKRGEGYAFLVFAGPEDVLVGGCNLSNVRRGSQLCATLGYWAGERHRNRGYITAAVKAISSFCFGTLGLHRVQAACLPDNEPSKSVLRKAGFREEGLARSYLKVDGNWRDHLLFGLVEDDEGR
ncbi:MAG: GNAT family N-acetyltransferase [Alphaproteobacteria bacterium]|nr:GNAT family N-acetyltransferase [Alphaproteobacteria bacterium]